MVTDSASFTSGMLQNKDTLQAVMDVLATPVFVKDREHRWVLANEALCNLIGCSKADLIGKSDHDYFPREVADVFWAKDDLVFATGEANENEELILDRDGNPRTILTHKRLVHIDGQPLLVAVITDVTAFRDAQAHSEYLALHDTLSGLPNRAVLREKLEELAAAGHRRGAHSALLYLDLDRFKQVNDAYGHPAGDELVQQFSKRLQGLVRASDLVARIGGDEFGVVAHGLGSSTGLVKLCRRILKAAQAPFEVAGTSVSVGVSIGVVSEAQKLASAVEMLRRGDVALYAAKSEGRNCFRIYNEEMDAGRRARLAIETELREALSTRKGLEVHYQPQISDGEITAVEALVRWDHPRLGLLAPAHFLPVAEETGLIVRIGDFVLEQVGRDSANWPDLRVAVNVSAVQLKDPDFGARMLGLCRRYGPRPDRLEIEIAESTVIGAEAAVRSNLQRLRAAGVSVALDDFGTGYSSLNHLHALEVDRVKIDRSFIDHIGNGADSSPIVRAVVHIGKMLGLKVTAEGVETEEQRRFLIKTGCRDLQGFLFSPPVPASEVPGLVARLKATETIAGDPVLPRG